MSRPAARSLADRLTVPFAPGADSLLLTLAGSEPDSAEVVPYDFAAHLARYGSLPAQLSYVLTARRDVANDTTVRFFFDLGDGSAGEEGSEAITIPAGTDAGASFGIDLKRPAGPLLRLKKLKAETGFANDPVPPAAEAWEVLALLGNLARVLWLVGAESQVIRRQLERIRVQRHLYIGSLPAAVAKALDWIGADLGVPRFPPRAYTFQEDTLALYHFDDGTGSDGMTLYKGRGHDAVNDKGRTMPAPGRFGNGLAFRNPADVLRAPDRTERDHSDFSLPADKSFTVECFVKPDVPPIKPLEVTAVWHLVAKHGDPMEDPTKPGWALSVGRFGSDPSITPRFLLSDGSGAMLLLVAGINLAADGRFHHLAGVVDRQRRQASLYVDGQRCVVKPLNSLGALTTPFADHQPLCLGAGADLGARGVLDEVRLSTAARTSFEPVLGESDDSYRKRLKLFRRWTLPTPVELQSVLNVTVGPLSEDPSKDREPLIVAERNAYRAGGSRSLLLGVSASPAPSWPGVYIQVGALAAAVNGTNVALSGVAPAANVNLSVTIRDSNGATTTGNYLLVVNVPLALGPLTPGKAAAGQSYAGVIPIAGGVAPFTLQGSSGLGALTPAVSGNNVKLTGTTQAATLTFGIKVKDGTGATATGNYTLAIGSGPALGILSPPQATAGQAYAGVIPIVGGASPFTLQSSTDLGTLIPAVSGSTITVNGVTPRANVSFSITVKDSTGAAATGDYLLAVNTLGPLAPGHTAAGTSYSGVIPIAGGVAPFSLQSSSGLGALTPAVSGSALTISGTAPAASITFSVAVKDSVGATITGTYTLAIDTDPALGLLSQPTATTGQAYNGTIPIVGGTGPFTFQDASAATGDTLPALPGFDLNVGQTMELTIGGLDGPFYLLKDGDTWLPVLTKPDAGEFVFVTPGTPYQVNWILIPVGSGRASTPLHNGNPVLDQQVLLLTATAPGELVVKAEVAWPIRRDAWQRTRKITRQTTLRIGLNQLEGVKSVAADGRLNVADDVVSPPNEFERSAGLANYLVTLVDPRVAFFDLVTRRMQVPVAAALQRLLDLLAAAQVPQQLQVISAFSPGNPVTPENVGRGLTLRHPTLDANHLGALTFAAGFTFTGIRSTDSVRVRLEIEDLVTIRVVRNQQGGQVVLPDPVAVAPNSSVTLEVAPRAGPSAAFFAVDRLYVANPLSDSVSEMDPEQGVVLRAFKVGWDPRMVAVRPESDSSPSPRRLFTADTLGGTVTAVSLGEQPTTQEFDTVARPVALAVSGSSVFVISRDNNRLARLDANDPPTAPTLDATVPQPTAVAATPDGSQVWVGVASEKRIHIFSSTATALSPLATITLAAAPSGLVLSPDGKWAFVSLPDTGQVAALDVVGRTVTQTVDLPPAPGAVAKPGALAVVDRGTQGLMLAVADADPTASPSGTPAFFPQVHLIDVSEPGPQLTLRASVAIAGAVGGLAAGMVKVGDKAVSRVFAVLPDADCVAVIDDSSATLQYVWGLGTGLGESLSWTVQPPSVTGLSSTTTPSIDLTALGSLTNPALVQALYTLPPGAERGTPPYTFEVRLNERLERLEQQTGQQMVIRKEEYDLIMNVLNTFCPLGIEVLTNTIRQRVKELTADLLDNLPEYTYPNFRLRARGPQRPFQERTP
jgi:hypothetical protein